MELPKKVEIAEKGEYAELPEKTGLSEKVEIAEKAVLPEKTKIAEFSGMSKILDMHETQKMVYNCHSCSEIWAENEFHPLSSVLFLYLTRPVLVIYFSIVPQDLFLTLMLQPLFSSRPRPDFRPQKVNRSYFMEGGQINGQIQILKR